jgi:hypothetical protein
MPDQWAYRRSSFGPGTLPISRANGVEKKRLLESISFAIQARSPGRLRSRHPRICVPLRRSRHRSAGRPPRLPKRRAPEKYGRSAPGRCHRERGNQHPLSDDSVVPSTLKEQRAFQNENVAVTGRLSRKRIRSSPYLTRISPKSTLRSRARFASFWRTESGRLFGPVLSTE